MPGKAGDGRIIGQVVDAFRACEAMGRQNEAEPERLRRLHRAQLRSLKRRPDPPVGVDCNDRIDDGRPRRSRAVGLSGLHGARDQRGRGERARSIMDQDHFKFTLG